MRLRLYIKSLAVLLVFAMIMSAGGIALASLEGEPCPNCGIGYLRDIGGASLAPTCLDDGYQDYTCDECGEDYRGVIPALGHNWGSWEHWSEMFADRDAWVEFLLSNDAPGFTGSTVPAGHDEWRECGDGDCRLIETRQRPPTPPPANGGGWDEGWYEPWTPPPPAPTPELAPEAPGEVTLGSGDLTALAETAVDGVIALIIEGDLEEVSITVPLYWFMENLGMTLVVFNEGVGMLTITSENLIELAALAYAGEEDGVTVEIRGREVTFRPDTLVTFTIERGSLTLAATVEGESLDWYIYDSSVVLGLLSDGGVDTYFLVAAQVHADGSETILPRSLYSGGLVYTMVNNEGRFIVRHNLVTFDDVAGGWMESAVRFLAARGVVSGVGDDLFLPQREVTRAEFTAMLMRTMDYRMDAAPAVPFADVSPDAWYHDVVAKAAALEITAGVGGGMFTPHSVITRQEMFTLTYNTLVRFWLLLPDDESIGAADSFADAEYVADWARAAMDALTHNGLVAGTGNVLNPQSPATRAEASQFLTNVIRLIVPDFTDAISVG